MKGIGRPRPGWAALVLAVFCPLAAPATTLLRVDVATLTKQADAVVVATVVGSASRRTSDGLRIVTDTELKVLQTLKGQVGDTATVMQPGGVVGDVGQHVAGVARFSPGEEVVVFLEKRGPRWFVAGMTQGKYRVERSTDGKAAFAVPARDAGATFVDPATGQESHAAPGPLKLEVLLAEIAKAAGQTAPAEAPTRPAVKGSTR